MNRLLIVTSMTLLLGGACDNDPAPDPCEGVTCSDHGTCLVDADNQAYCECDTCYAADELTCGREEVEVSADVTEPTVWQSHQIILLTDYIDVTSELVIEECAEVRMLNDGAIYVLDNGAIKSEGSAQYPVTFTSSETTPAAGDWRNIEIEVTASPDSSFDHTIFEYGGGGLTAYGMLYVEGGAEVAVTNSTFRDGQMHAAQFDDGAIVNEFAGNSFDNIEAELIQVHPDAVASLSPITSTNNTRNVVLIMGGETLSGGTWKNLSVPYETNDMIYISSEIAIEEGITVLMGDDTSFYVQDLGTFSALGTVSAPVTFTSSMPEPAAGDWRNIEIYPSAGTGSRFDYTVFEYGGGYGNGFGLLRLLDGGASVEVTNSTFRNCRLHAVQFEPGAQILGFTNNSFDNIETELIQIHPDAVASLSPITSTNNVHEVVLIKGGDTVADGTWSDLGVPYETDGYIYILDTITVEAGVTLLMGDDLAIYVMDLGTLLLDGTTEAHVTVTSAQPVPLAGDWRNIDIDDTASTDSVFRFTDFIYGGATGGAISYGMIYVDYIAELTLEDVTFSDAMACDIYQRGTINATNSPFNLCPP
jgi:hypothetical protein